MILEESTNITLAASLDLTTAPALKDELRAAMAGGIPVICDAAQVSRITTPALQVLVAAIRTSERQGGNQLRFHNPSAAFTEAASALGLADVLHLGAANV